MSSNLISQEMIQRHAWKELMIESLSRVTESNLQNVHTPFELCQNMIGKLKEYTSLDGKNILCFNMEFIEVLIYDFDVKRENIWFITDCPEKIRFCHLPRYRGVNLLLGDHLKLEYEMKFDVVIMNPPYQAPKGKENEGRGKCGKSIWEDFIKNAFLIVKKTGYICAIHPSRWRKPESDIGEKIKHKNVKYLEIHNLDDGLKTFGCQTRYDWYVLQNNSSDDNITILKDEEGQISSYNIQNLPFIPNSKFKDIMMLVAKEGEEKVELLYSRSLYGTDKKNMSKEKTEEFKHPCVYSINSKGVVKFWYSSKKEDFFKVPKVIFPSGAFQSVDVLVDEEGEYGLTQFARGIVDKPENLSKIAIALRSKKFIDLYFRFTMGSTELDKNIVKNFRKDFWKLFVNEDGTKKE